MYFVKGKLSMAVVIIIALAAAVPPFATATTIIDGTTFGFYNAGLGDLSTDSTLGSQTDIATGFNLFPIANVGGGDPTIPPVATEPNLSGADTGTQANLGNFLSNTTTLGGTWSAASQAIPSTWTVNDETAIVYEFDAGAGLTDFTINIGVDNGVFVWFDGLYQLGALAPGGAFANEYNLNVGAVTGGTHFVQILREDHGGSTGFIISATANAAAPVPEPATMLLFGSGLIGIVAYRRFTKNV